MLNELQADLTLVWDGRWSVCRQEAGLNPQDFPAGVDIWWFQLPPVAEVLAAPPLKVAARRRQTGDPSIEAARAGGRSAFILGARMRRSPTPRFQRNGPGRPPCNGATEV
jgi:2-polyprenyl-6-methoxyphenol hydroxylase-like FAD-dependent oxidoreductase